MIVVEKEIFSVKNDGQKTALNINHSYKLTAQLNQWESHFYLYLLVLQWYTFYVISLCISFSSSEYKHERGIKINENKTNEMKWKEEWNVFVCISLIFMIADNITGRFLFISCPFTSCLHSIYMLLVLLAISSSQL